MPLCPQAVMLLVTPLSLDCYCVLYSRTWNPCLGAVCEVCGEAALSAFPVSWAHFVTAFQVTCEYVNCARGLLLLQSPEVPYIALQWTCTINTIELCIRSSPVLHRLALILPHQLASAAPSLPQPCPNPHIEIWRVPVTKREAIRRFVLSIQS